MLELKHVAQGVRRRSSSSSDLNLHIERGDRIALVGPNGAGKSTLMRMLSGEEAPDAGERIDGHNVVMQYFAQDEATRLDPAPTVYETLAVRIAACTWCRRSATSSAASSSRATTSTSRCGVLSGGERTRLAVARMLLRPSNTLLLDEPTNHLDLDSKDVLLDALVDYGGTLIFVSHDRYFVERLATKIIEIGNGTAHRLSRAPTRSSCGTRSTPRQDAAGQSAGRARRRSRPAPRRRASASGTAGARRRATPDEPRRTPGERRARPKQRQSRREEARRRRGAQAAEARAERAPGADRRRSRRGSPRREAGHPRARSSRCRRPGFYDDRAAAQPVIDRHQALMWQVGDLMHQWEELQSPRDLAEPTADRIVIRLQFCYRH